MAMAGGRSGEVGQGRGQVGQVGWVLTGFISFFGQEKNKMKLKGADLEHEQHEALVEHYQVEIEPMGAQLGVNENIVTTHTTVEHPGNADQSECNQH